LRTHLLCRLRTDAVPDRPLHLPRLSPPASGRTEAALAALPVAAVVALAGPRREDEQNARTVDRGDRPTLVHVEGEEAARPALDGLAAAVDANRAVDDGDERPLLHLVVAELLARIESDQHGTSRIVRAQPDGRPTAAGRFDLAQVPALHRRDPKRARRSRLTHPGTH